LHAGGNVGLVFNTNTVLDLALSQPVELRLNSPKRVRVQVTQPFLCADFATTTSTVGLELYDPNGLTGSLLRGGITAIDFQNVAPRGLLKVTAPSASLACCLMLPSANAFCFQGPLSSASTGGSQPNQIFRAGFENVTTEAEKAALSAADLTVVVSSAQATRRAGETWTYTIVVTNIGTTNVSSVRVRDWFPRSPNFQTALGAGSWSCAAVSGSSCSSGSGSGSIAVNLVSLNAGKAVTYTVNRPLVSSPAPPVGSTLWVSAAAFAPATAAETVLANNQGAVSLRVVQ